MSRCPETGARRDGVLLAGDPTQAISTDTLAWQMIFCTAEGEKTRERGPERPPLPAFLDGVRKKPLNAGRKRDAP